MSSAVPLVQLLIHGVRRAARNRATFPVYNSYSNKLVTNSASASSEDAQAAVESAHRAFPAWEATAPHERRDVFLRAASIMESDRWRKEVSESMLSETSSTVPWQMYNTMSAPNVVRGFAGMVNELRGETFQSVVPGGQVFIQRRGQGVIYSMCPWNSPVTLTLRGVVAPLICGNTVVLKPSEHSPRTQSLVVDAFQEAGLPPGVLNFLPMSRENSPKLTAEIIAHPHVKNVTFTGSDTVGKKIAEQASRHLKPCILELGGKSPAVVLKDADIDQAVRGILLGAFMNAGQICMSTERVIVQRPVAEKLISKLKARIASLGWKAGDPRTSFVPPLFSERSAENVRDLLQEAKAAGAEILLGDGERSGAVVQPHMVTGVRPGMRLWERESFGPVMLIAVVDTIEEAIELANATEYTLTSSIWTKDLYNAMNIASRIRAAAANINGPTVHVELLNGNSGLGGASGYGCFDVQHLTDRRMIVLHPSERSYPVPHL
ncbi:aldehyde dehydrogenase [Dentipellis sp. KUC8613]|nr:aldehyde dehydrogenase [Dentipellis sp. KUC8613]